MQEFCAQIRALGWSVATDDQLILEDEDEPHSETLIMSRAEIVDNGVVFWDSRGKWYSLCSDFFPFHRKPGEWEPTLNWLKGVYFEGIQNSTLFGGNTPFGKTPMIASAFLKTIAYDKANKKYSIEYKRSCDFLSRDTKPWVLLSDQPKENFAMFDSVDLYRQMSKQDFSPGEYSYRYLKNNSGTLELVSDTVGWFCCPLLIQDWINPTYYYKKLGQTVRFSIRIPNNSVVEGFAPEYWIAKDDPNGEAEEKEKRPPSIPDGGEAKLQLTEQTQRGPTWTVRERTLK